MSRQLSREEWLRRITHPVKPLIQRLRESGYNPDEWISLKEAAARLNMSESGAWKAAILYGWLRHHKEGRRRLVEVDSVERFRTHRESRKSRSKSAQPKPPTEQIWKDDDPAHNWYTKDVPSSIASDRSSDPSSVIGGPSSHPNTQTPTHTNTLQPDGRLWRDLANDDIWVPVDRACNVLLIGPDQIGQLALQGKLRRKWQHKTTWEEIQESQVVFRGRPQTGAELTIDNPPPSVGGPSSDVSGQSSVDRGPSTINHQPSTVTSVWSGRVRAMYSMRDLLALAEKRSRTGRNRSFPANDQERPVKCVRIKTDLTPPPNDSFLTRNEAASFLEVSPSRITSLVLAGTLFAWQAEPGKPGCPQYLSANQVQRLANRWDHVKRREAYLKGKNGKKKEWKPNWFQEDRHLWDPPQKAAKRDHGEFYTTLQASQVLGITRDTVLTMRRNGRLQGHRSPDSTNFKQTFNRKRWWFYKKTDVHDLKADRERKKRSKAYWKGRMPWAYGDEAELPPFEKGRVGEGTEYRPHEWNPKPLPTDNPFDELREGMRNW